MKEKLMTWMMVMILLTSFTNAFGILPAKQSVKLELLPLEYQGSFQVVNNQQDFLDLVIYPTGPMTEFITIKDQRIRMNPDEQFREVHFTIKMSEDMPRGEVESRIIVEEVPAEATQLDRIGSRLKLFHKVTVTTPFKGKYVGASVSIKQIDENYEVITTINNLGEEAIDVIKASHKILDETKQLFTLHSAAEKLATAQSDTLRTTFGRTVLGEGQYNLLSLINYDEEVLEMSNSFLVGEPKIKLTNLDSSLIAGEISKAKFSVLSDWNEDIPEVFADIILHRDGKAVASATTEKTTLVAKKLTTLDAFLDTEDLSSGEYTMSIKLYYLVFSEEFERDIVLDQDKSLQQPRSSEQPNTLLYIILAFLIMLSILFAMMLMQFYRIRRDEE